MKKSHKTQLFIILIGGVCLLFFKISIFKTTEIEAQYQLKTIVKEINRKCPTTIDEGLKLDSASTSYDTLHYYLTFPFLKLDPVFNDERKSRIELNAVRFLKQRANMKYFREEETPLVYHYFDMYKEEMFKIGIQYQEDGRVKKLF
ncbi:hypothetical protein K5X82_16175 [Halosquirtibacter xylanolyticus]|uniref:hypothetical protein n=1 Tax=Halosquirtibacter xylanolyticus TaxID=3374599 RepID=UPI0037497E5B|nr:hypothetical protein K5X82_16175 [Prolixibacteraceae bacterium]